jgi:hypothetical protein
LTVVQTTEEQEELFRAQLVEIHEACGARGVKIEGKIEGDAGLYSL